MTDLSPLTRKALDAFAHAVKAYVASPDAEANEALVARHHDCDAMGINWVAPEIAAYCSAALAPEGPANPKHGAR